MLLMVPCRAIRLSDLMKSSSVDRLWANSGDPAANAASEVARAAVFSFMVICWVVTWAAGFACANFESGEEHGYEVLLAHV
jgi:hypothetical protein